MSVALVGSAVTSIDAPPPPVRSRRGDPTWEIAYLFPAQGDWTEQEYLALTESNWLVELYEGRLEVLAMPTIEHQLIVNTLRGLLDAYIARYAVGGLALFAPVPVWLGSVHYREPDIFYLAPDRAKRTSKHPNGADLVMEVVSEDRKSYERDHVEKRVFYAAAGIPEYWIVDPREQTITVLTLEGTAYREHGVFRPGSQATSVLLAGFAADVTAVFAAAQAAGQANP